MTKVRTLTKIGFALAAYATYKFVDTSFSMIPNQSGLYKLGTKVTAAGFGAMIGGIVGSAIEEGFDILDEYQKEKHSCKCSCDCHSEDEEFVDADILHDLDEGEANE